MPALDVQAAVYARVWALLEARSDFTSRVKLANRIKSSQRDATQRDGIKTDPASFPKVRITVAEDTAHDKPPMPICDDPALVDLPVPMTLNVDIKIVHDKTILESQTPLEAAVRAGLLSAGRTLGLLGPNGRPYVSNFVCRGVKRGDETSADTGNELRTIARMRLVVTARPMRSFLIAT